MIKIFYTPTIISPNALTAIDGNDTNIFEWQVNSTSPDSQVAYQVFIYRNDTNALVYDGTKQTSTNEYHSLSPALSNTSSYQYKWKVRVWKDGSNYLDSAWSLFYAISTPTITFVPSTPITSQNYEFSATYSQSEAIKLKQYKYLLYDSSATPNLITDYDWIYTTSSTPTYEVTGMVSGDDYNIKIQTINQFGQSADSALIPFSVSYTYPDNVPEFFIENRDDIGALYLNWTNLKQIIGVLSPSSTPNYVTGKFGYGIQLPNGTILTYTDTVLEDYSLTFWIKFPSGFTGDFVVLGDDEFIVGFNGTKFYWQFEERIVAGTVLNSYISETLYPSEELYPSENLTNIDGHGWFLIGLRNDAVLIKSPYFEDILG